MAESPSVQTTDVELLLRVAIEEDGDALRGFLAIHKERVYGWLCKHHGEQVAEEAFYRAAFKVWKYADRYTENKGAPGPWFLRIAQNEALSVLKGEKRHVHADLVLDPSYDPGDCGLEGEAEYSDSRKEREKSREQRRRDLSAIVERLPKQQQAITKADLCDPSGTAPAGPLAAMLETSTGSIYVSRNKAREAIRREMTRLGHYPANNGGRTNAR